MATDALPICVAPWEKSKMATKTKHWQLNDKFCEKISSVKLHKKHPANFSSTIYELFVLISAPVAHNKQCWPVICQSWCQNSNFDRCGFHLSKVPFLPFRRKTQTLDRFRLVAAPMKYQYLLTLVVMEPQNNMSYLCRSMFQYGFHGVFTGLTSSVIHMHYTTTGVHAPPTRSTPHLRGPRPPYGKSWIRHCGEYCSTGCCLHASYVILTLADLGEILDPPVLKLCFLPKQKMTYISRIHHCEYITLMLWCCFLYCYNFNIIDIRIKTSFENKCLQSADNIILLWITL